ncbi:MAG TPA: MerR family transcriptional regulator [Polyangia bacterium]|nr:MerR family transcriptional regulator [Polyangia bacterium]
MTKGADTEREPSGLLPSKELDAIERAHPEGLTAAQVVEVFQRRGLKLSEATFRKYVQLGLLPRSRRVGRKGKHQGSMGLYPATAVRRVNAIKRMMAEGQTIQEIQGSFLRFKDEIEALERGLKDVFSGFERELRAPEFDAARRKTLSREIEDAKKLAGDLVGRIETLERQIVSPLERAARARAFSSGASGGAGDLL